MVALLARIPNARTLSAKEFDRSYFSTMCHLLYWLTNEEVGCFGLQDRHNITTYEQGSSREIALSHGTTANENFASRDEEAAYTMIHLTVPPIGWGNFARFTVSTA